MRGVLYAALLLVMAEDAQAQTYKCTDSLGHITYAQQPCPGNADQRKIGPARSVPESGVRPSVSLQERKVGPINFGETPEIQLITARSVLESLRVDGRDCEWALKVNASTSV